jgi:hypothetical protein
MNRFIYLYLQHEYDQKGETVIQLARYRKALPAVLALALAGCLAHAPIEKPEKLIVYSDGSMEFRNKPIPERDVIIYPDGYGGEKAAVRIRMEPLHPDFFRDTIVVERKEE